MVTVIERARENPHPPEVEDVTRREFLVGTAGLLVLAPYGCTGEEARQEATGETRGVEHALGTTEIPTEPRRIVVTDQLALDAVLALGASVVGAAEQNIAGSRGRQFADRLEGVESIGSLMEPNFERVAALEPDLIIGFNLGSLVDQYDSYSQIAPAVGIAFDTEDQTIWREQLRRFGEILNREDQARERISDYESRVGEIRGALEETLGRRLSETTVSTLRFYTGKAQYRTVVSFPVGVLDDVGFARPPQQRESGSEATTYVDVSLERVELLDGDIIFAALDPGSEEIVERFRGNPLWQRLEAVEKDRVYEVDSGYWIFGNVLAANAILDDLERFLLR